MRGRRGFSMMRIVMIESEGEGDGWIDWLVGGNGLKVAFVNTLRTGRSCVHIQLEAPEVFVGLLCVYGILQ